MSDVTAAAPSAGASGTNVPPQRLLSLDALRGFDMFWIVGGEEIVHALYKAWPSGPLHSLDRQLDHQPWQGVAFYDLIFPLFVFIVGVSLVFSVSRMVERRGKAAPLKRIVLRSLALYLLGIFYYGGLSKGVEHIRWMGVLQRISLCYLFTGLSFCVFRVRALIALCAALLLGYWALLSLVPIRDFNLEKHHLEQLQLKPEDPETRARFLATTNLVRGRFDDGLNLTQQLDFRYLPGFKWDGAYDPEGLLSTLPAVGTCLLGVFAGLFLKNSRAPDQKKVLLLLGAGAASVCLGFLWGLQFPVIKKIWTSSYVLVAGGYGAIILAIFFQIVEIGQHRDWCRPFVWIGMNPITIYLSYELIHFDDFADRLAGGQVKQALGRSADLVLAVLIAAMVLALARFLYHRKIFLRL